ncbi:MAG: ferritin [Gammaproteobacteria bacterium]|nr:ferritin [Gammaproteobacteria bacterium]
MSSENLHEDRADLPEEVIDKHRAITSLMEEFEAVDWYDQRASATQDPELRAVLLHNRNEEMEHAAMVLEWLRRKYPVIDEQLRNYLFKEGERRRRGARSHGPGRAGRGTCPFGTPRRRPAPAPIAADGSLGIGSLRD